MNRPSLGQQIGNYRIVRFLGTGGFADVYLGEHIYLRSSVALKFLRIAFTTEAKERFLTEARSMSHLTHPRILRVLDFGIEDEMPFLVMDYAPGGTLRDRHPLGCQVPLATVVAYVSDIALAVQYVHERGFLHLDLKPANLLVGSHDEIFLGDFGIARMALPVEAAPSPTNRPFGTIGYMAPEQMRGQPCPASDQYALAVIVYEWLSGKAPFTGSTAEIACQHLFATPPSFSAQHVTLPPAVEQVVFKALEKNPSDRFDSVTRFASFLVQVSQPFTVGALVPPSRVTQPSSIAPSGPTSQDYEGAIYVHNIPAPLTPLLGREQQSRDITMLLLRDDVRLVTITGMGGMGKTRLAQQVGNAMLDRFRHGVCFVPLSPIRDPHMLLPTISRSLGRWQVRDQSPFEDLKEFLQDKQLLLVLDNFEQILEAASTLVSLLEGCPRLKILVTSRALLRVRGEYQVPLTPLEFPDLRHLPPLTELAQMSSVALLLQYVQAFRPTFQLTEQNAPIIAEICARLDGVPLAIELAAARLKLLTPQALLRLLDHQLLTLGDNAQHIPSRQQTLRSTIDWSVDLLNSEEQCVFRRLGVFVDGCSLEAAEAVCSAPGDLTTPFMDLILSLLDKSLLSQHATEQEDEETRLSQLEALRAYAQEKLQLAGERECIQQAHAIYYLEMAEQAEPALYHAQQGRWMQRLDRDFDNLRAAFLWLQERKQGQMLVRLAGALAWFWCWRGHLQEGLCWIEQVLREYEQESSVLLRSKLLAAAGLLAGFLNQRDHARKRCLEALKLCQESGNMIQYMHASWMLTLLHLLEGDLSGAQTRIEGTCRVVEGSHESWVRADIQGLVGTMKLAQGEYLQAKMCFEACRALFAEAGDLLMHKRFLVSLAEVALAQRDEAGGRTLLKAAFTPLPCVRDTWPQRLYLFGMCALRQGDLFRARILIEEGVKLYQHVGDQRGVWEGSLLLARIAAIEQDYTSVFSILKRHCKKAQALGEEVTILVTLEELVRTALSQGQASWAARLCGLLDRCCELFGASCAAAKSATCKQVYEQIQQQIGRETFALLWQEGYLLLPYAPPSSS